MHITANEALAFTEEVTWKAAEQARDGGDEAAAAAFTAKAAEARRQRTDLPPAQRLAPRPPSG